MVIVVPEVTVLIHRKKDGILTARVVQEAADGPVTGRNLLTGRQITRIQTAQVEVEAELNGMVKLINWTYEEV